MRSLPGLALLSLLAFPSLLACSHPRAIAPARAASRAPNHHQALPSTPPPSVFLEQRGPTPTGVVERGPSCPAAVGIAPTPFFDEHLLIRLPPEIEGEQVPAGSGFARSPRPLAMGCEDGLAASVFLARSYQAALELPRVRSLLFADLNFPTHVETVVVRGSDSDDDVSMSISFPDNAVWGNTQVYLRMFKRYGRAYSVGFIADASSYHRLEPLFAASADTMVALP